MHALYICAKRYSAIPRAGRVAIRGAGIRSVKQCDGGVRRVAHEAVIDAARVREVSNDDALCVNAARKCVDGASGVKRREGSSGVRGIGHEAVTQARRIIISSRDRSKKIDACRISTLPDAGWVAIRGAGTRSINRREGAFGVRGIGHVAVSYTVRITVVSGMTPSRLMLPTVVPKHVPEEQAPGASNNVTVL